MAGVSTRPILGGGEGWYTGRLVSKSINYCVFPGSFELDDAGYEGLLFYGWQDHFGRIARINISVLLDHKHLSVI